DRARVDCENAITLFREAGDLLGEAKALRSTAYILADEGDKPAAHKAMHLAAKLFSRAGDTRSHDETEAEAKSLG
ncbi:MAG: tetratricopeptide repeat protein, partial [Rhodospirillaceae bacterium]|nr:tetratricopeptide repeat protein [Rhodospirillaceae bacterium]